MVVKMEQKDMNNLSPAELKAMADALLAADDEKQAKTKTKAAPAADKTAAADKPEAEKDHGGKAQRAYRARQKRPESSRARISWRSRT